MGGKAILLSDLHASYIRTLGLSDEIAQLRRALLNVRQELININGDAHYFGDVPQPQVYSALIKQISTALSEGESDNGGK